MSRSIQIRNDLLARLQADKENTDKSYSDVITELYDNKDTLINQVTFDDNGRFPGSRGLAGKTILYKVKD